MITQDRLKELFNYNPNTGKFTRILQVNGQKAGTIAGSINSDGYAQIRIDTGRYKAHRLAFLYMTGKLPDAEIDHINGIRDDNRWCNLRAVSKGENQRNAKLRCDSKTGIVGICWNANDKAFVATIQHSGVRRRLKGGDMLTVVAARLRAERELGFHPNHGR